jgi:DNA-binding Lrp family transcriptional regulator
MTISNRFILKPDFHNLAELGLNYKDLLTYITIRSFHNSKSKHCYPSYRAISKLSGLSTYFVGKSMKRLKDAGILNAWKVVGRRRTAYWYAFDEVEDLFKVPYELLTDPDLTTNEKSILALLLEYCKDGYCAKSIDEIADKSGVTKRSIEYHYETLLLKGYISESMYEDPLAGILAKHFILTRKMDWDFRVYDKKCEATNWAMTMIDIVSSRFTRGNNLFYNQK